MEEGGKMKSNYPNINYKLIDKLKIDYPNKLPDKKISEYELGYLIGQQSIIEKLEFELKEQEDSIIEG